MRAAFYLAFEFGYESDEVEVEVLAKTDYDSWYLAHLPPGYSDVQGLDIEVNVRDGMALLCIADLDRYAGELDELPMWTPEQKALFADPAHTDGF